jgi:DNA invertase Pin-like site-specific DNA recombinase
MRSPKIPSPPPDDRPAATARENRPRRELAALVGTKIQDHHFTRLAVVYVRQSTPRQVLDHRESTALQYSLAERAEQYGWPKERVLIIDDDQGQSGRSADCRLGFQRLLAEVGLNHVGLVLGIEMSRLTRSCKDWYNLIELCALFRCLLADQDGLYDPRDPNDRLLLGVKGTLSEAEWHLIQNRMQQGSLNKARRGDLEKHLPSGYMRQATGEVVLDPDEQAQAVVRMVFEAFTERGTAMAVLRYLRQHGIRLPVRPLYGPNKGQLEWRVPGYSTIIHMLHNPAYAGLYVHGRYQTDPQRAAGSNGSHGRFLAKIEDWKVTIPGRLPAYISWETFMANQKRLQANRSLFDTPGVPRNGAALLAGILVCGKCGRRMHPAYKGDNKPISYFCDGGYPQSGDDKCQRVAARSVDCLVTEEVLRAVEPASLQLSLRAAERLRNERQRLHEHWRQQLERATFQAERAKRQYDAVEPENRLVARELERRWEEALGERRRLEEDYQRFQRVQPEELSASEVQRITALAESIPMLWSAASTTAAERQTIVRHLIDQVVLTAQGETEMVGVAIRWRGGHLTHHELTRPVARYEQLRDFVQLKERITGLWTAGSTTTAIAERLNQEGFHMPRGQHRHTRKTVRKLIDAWGLSQPKRVQLEAARAQLQPNEYWLLDLGRELGINRATLARWCRRGWVHARRLTGPCAWWVVWADAEERDRLRRLYAYGRGCPGPHGSRYPKELRTPKPRQTRVK